MVVLTHWQNKEQSTAKYEAFFEGELEIKLGASQFVCIDNKVD